MICGGNVVGLDAPFFQTVPNEMELSPDVLASVMEDRVLGQREGRLVIHP